MNKTMTVDPDSCPQNHRCPAIAVCPVNAISQSGFGLPVVDPDLCIHCGVCQRYCPMGAFMEQV